MRSIFRFLTAITCLLSLASCGGGSGSASVQPLDAPATVSVLITDAPVGRWDEAIATITSVRLLGDSGQATLFSGSQTLDLLKLGDFSELFAVSDNVPAGGYSKIRLQLSDLVLNDLDPDTGAVLESIRPQLVGNGKIDLNPQGSFNLAPGDIVIVELDFDMAKSLKITETGNGKIIIRPVVFVNIRTDRPTGRLSRIHGKISRLGPVSGDFVLCQTDFASRWDDDTVYNLPKFGDSHCLSVSTDEATGVFGENGLPETLADLAIGEEVTVIGRLQATAGFGPRDDDDHPLELDAYVIEEGPLGTYTRTRGVTASTIDGFTNRFNLDVAAGQGFVTDAPLPVQLFSSSRIFNRAGVELDTADILTGLNALVDSVLVIGADDFIRSPLVILDEGITAPEVAIEGDIVSVNATAKTLLVNDGTMDRCIDAATASIFLVNDDDGLSSSRGTLNDLSPGQDVAIFGAERIDGCLAADTILASTE